MVVVRATILVRLARSHKVCSLIGAEPGAQSVVPTATVV